MTALIVTLANPECPLDGIIPGCFFACGVHNQKILRKAFLILTLDMRKAFLTANNSGEDIWKISVSEVGGRRFTMLPPLRV
ncbi:hypothetical protein [Rhizobium rhizogenes]|uniref:hypothetical protein n=1 Tax=Rhizobium rhizogenes TaxID=359 RepID=UPI0012D348FC|nr:hypothetical protein [Rhizobium rhizogenes]